MSASYLTFIRRGAIIALLGFILSGPVAVVLVTLLHPQPQWVSVSVFVEHYHPMQNLPYYLGFFLLTGMLMFAFGHWMEYDGLSRRIRINLGLALALTIVFFGLISFNYICQTTFVHNLTTHYRPEYESLIAGFSMSNPESFCWANEMWGYGLLGIATWLTASYYNGKSNFIRWLLVANGVISLISPAWTIIDPNWVMTPTGFVLYLIWNALMIVLMIAIIRFTKTPTA